MSKFIPNFPSVDTQKLEHQSRLQSQDPEAFEAPFEDLSQPTRQCDSDQHT